MRIISGRLCATSSATRCEPDGVQGRKLSLVQRRCARRAEGDEPQRLEILRRNVEKGLPCGSEKFIQLLEKLTGQALPYRPRDDRSRRVMNKGSVPITRKENR